MSRLTSLCATFLLTTSTYASEKPLTMDASVAIAWRQSPQAKVAEYTRQAAQVQADREKPVALPTLDATASGTAQGPRVTFPRPDGTQATVLPEGYGQFTLTAEQTLYRAGFGAAWQRYAAQSAIATQDYRKALADLALSVRKAYLDVQKAESGVRQAQDGVDAAVRYQALVMRQVAAGVAKPVDAATVKAQVAEAQSGLTTATGGLMLARLNFNRTLGRPLETPVELEASPALPEVPDSPQAAIETAYRHRPELRGLEENLRAARAGISLAKTQSQPALSVRGQVTEQTPSAFLHEHYASASLLLRWPLLDGGKTRLDTREARAHAARVAALQEDARQGIALDVTQAWQQMRDAKARIALAVAQREGATSTQTVAEKAYEVGRGTVQEVQAAQRETRTARERELQAEYDLRAASADFLHAQGVTAPVELAPASKRQP